MPGELSPRFATTDRGGAGHKGTQKDNTIGRLADTLYSAVVSKHALDTLPEFVVFLDFRAASINVSEFNEL